ncbi:THUMP domain-containing protein [Methanobacterium sp. MBAC-LM]|uniref:THUMP domain-containing protein n=1 Tax=Methanobacterium sp. MBAC-LM TaxID=3412034 RepID=UPI003C74B62A
MVKSHYSMITHNFNILIITYNSNSFLLGGGRIKPIDGFNLLVTLQGHKDSHAGEELVGIEEIELALSSYEPVLYIKESQYPNVVLVELTMDPEEAVAILSEAPTTVVSKVVPIDAVIKTRMDSIWERAMLIAREKMNSDDSFVVRCDLRGREYIESKNELIEKVTNELLNNMDIRADEINPGWIVQIEVVGEDTGVSVLKPHQILKKI